MKRSDPSQFGLRLRKLPAALGIIPLGLFVVVHLWEHAAATGGPRAYEERLAVVEPMTGHAAFRVLGVYLPLALHALYGLRKTAALVRSESSPSSWADRLQHVAGIVILLFVGYHVSHLGFRTGSGPILPEDYFFALASALSSVTEVGIPAVASLYVLGAAAVSYHLAHGLSAFCTSSGLTASAGAQRRARWAFALFGLILFVTSTRTILYFATGS